MNLIGNITDDANQTVSVVLDDASVATLTLRYYGATRQWVMDVVHDKLTAYGITVTTYPNILRQFRNKINFGLMCYVADGTDPILIDDFSTGRAQLFSLNADDVASAESIIGA